MERGAIPRAFKLGIDAAIRSLQSTRCIQDPQNALLAGVIRCIRMIGGNKDGASQARQLVILF